MALFGDDCYFYYYSSCNKGLNCPYRHVPEARGIETSCVQWKAGHCTRPSCRFRHMEIAVDRSNIPCYWESQPSGCAKPHCPFKHYANKKDVIPEPVISERCVVAPVNKAVVRTLDRSTPSPTSRSSPKIEPVVVNPSSDDSDEGSPLKRQQMMNNQILTQIDVTKPKVICVRRTSADECTDIPDIKVKTLAEIRREKEMIQIINNSLEKPLEEESETEPYHFLERPEYPVRRIVLETPEEPQKVQPIAMTTTVQQRITTPVSPAKGNIKSRLGRKMETNGDEVASSVVPEKIKSNIISRLGTPTPIITNENNDDCIPVSEIQIKSLEEIKSAKLRKRFPMKKEDPKKKDNPSKTVTRRITVTEEEPALEIKSLCLADIRRKRTLAALKTDNKQECEQEQDQTEKARKRGVSKNKPKTIKQERAIYVPPGSKKTENKTSVSTSKKSRLSCSPEKTDSTDSSSQVKSAKLNVKTFAELMAEKRKKKLEEEQKETEKTKHVPMKSTRSNFIPIVFDLDQKEKMATPKVVAATLPFRYKKSALVAPIQNQTDEKTSKSSVSEEATCKSKNTRTQIVRPVVSSGNTRLSKDDQSEALNNSRTEIKQSSPELPQTTPKLNEVCRELVNQPVKIASAKSAYKVTGSIISANKCRTKNLVIQNSEQIPEISTPAPVKRKSSSVESNSEKKKSRSSFRLSEDDDLLFDDDDNNFTLSSEKYDDDDADILGDIDALLA